MGLVCRVWDLGFIGFRYWVEAAPDRTTPIITNCNVTSHFLVAVSGTEALPGAQ